jgi:hypothetical protein
MGIEIVIVVNKHSPDILRQVFFGEPDIVGEYKKSRAPQSSL